jgi:hypothetical protein
MYSLEGNIQVDLTEVGCEDGIRIEWFSLEFNDRLL